MRNLREQSGDEYPSKLLSMTFIAKAAKFLNNMKQADEQNSHVLFNMARM